MEISVLNEQNDLIIDEEQVRRLVKTVIAAENKTYDEAAIHFVSQKEICALHEEFFQDPSPTDCISFPIDSDNDAGYRMMGDVFVCPKTAIDYSRIHGVDPVWETTLYIVHGLLHLMGYEDHTEEEIKKMRDAEERNMILLKEMHFMLCSSDK